MIEFKLLGALLELKVLEAFVSGLGFNAFESYFLTKLLREGNWSSKKKYLLKITSFILLFYCNLVNISILVFFVV